MRTNEKFVLDAAKSIDRVRNQLSEITISQDYFLDNFDFFKSDTSCSTKCC